MGRSYYVVNYQGYYFHLDESVVDFIDEHCLRHEGCELFDSIDDMFEHLKDKLGLERDELEGNEITISCKGDNMFYETCGRGIASLITEPFDFWFITEYEL